MNSKKILVIGSSNTDMVIKTNKFPAPGETILGGKFLMNPGGKGANQAVAAQRLGGNVTFIGKTGHDIFGRQAVELLKSEGINTEFMVTDSENPSGVALITVDKNGENSIVVASGANGTLSTGDLVNAQALFETADIILLQLEIPLNTVISVAELSVQKGRKVILNPAPAQPLPESLLKGLYMITPNESEAGLLTGMAVTDVASADRAALELKRKGVQNVIITMGAAGAYVLSAEFTGMVAAPGVMAVDTTAAGDTFNGALALFLSERKTIHEAVRLACKAASIAVTRIGAQASIPRRKEVMSKSDIEL